MLNAELKVNLGPGEAGEASPSRFLLSGTEWLSIQTFVHTALTLPTTLTLLASDLPSKPSGGIDQYLDLVTSYKTLNTSCTNFNTVIMPDSIKCASNLISYNLKVPRYYGAVITELQKLIETPTTPEQKAANEKVWKNVRAVCDNLSKDAKAYAEHANGVYTALQGFAEETESNQREVIRLNKKYSDKLNDKDGSIATLTKQLEKDKAELENAQDEYEHDVIVAATTATYAFVWPFGTIAAGIVAGIYGDKAVKAKAKIEAFKALVEELKGTIKSDTIISLDLAQIKGTIDNIDKKISAALPSIHKIANTWNGINASLENIKKLIKEDITDQEEFLADIGVQTAIEDWQKIADKAEDYRINAYIKVKPESETEQVVQAGLKLQRKLKLIHSAV